MRLEECKMKETKNTRIYKWFKGEILNHEVKFRFTYSWDMNEQVIIKFKNGFSKKVSLEIFKNEVKAKQNINDVYVLA